MKKDIHPKVYEMTVSCACGTKFETTSTKQKIEIDICSGCHPLFTGTQKFIDRAGRIERFQSRYSSAGKSKDKKKK